MEQETGTPKEGRRICRIRLSDGERAELRQLEDSGAAAHRRRRARLLPLADRPGGPGTVDAVPEGTVGKTLKKTA